MACPSCFQGYIRTDTTPTGSISTIHNLQTYIARPPSPSSSTTTPKGLIVFIPDAFGWEFPNNRLLADSYARAGFLVYLPDFMASAAAPPWFLTTMDELTSLSPSPWNWLSKPIHAFWALYALVPFLWHNLPSTSHPRVTRFLERLRASPTSDESGLKIGVAGFCWGGKHAVQLASPAEAHLVDAVFTAHPSLLTLPDEIEAVRKPLSIAVGDGDGYLPLKQVERVKKILGNLEEGGVPEGVRHEVVVYEGAGHGFSVRIDVKNSKQVEQSLQAERQAVAWFERMLV